MIIKKILESQKCSDLSNGLLYTHTSMRQVLGPASQASAAPSEAGSLGSEWARAYEDEDTWYDFSGCYQTGPDTHLLPTRDSSE